MQAHTGGGETGKAQGFEVSHLQWRCLEQNSCHAGPCPCILWRWYCGLWARNTRDDSENKSGVETAKSQGLEICLCCGRQHREIDERWAFDSNSVVHWGCLLSGRASALGLFSATFGWKANGGLVRARRPWRDFMLQHLPVVRRAHVREKL